MLPARLRGRAATYAAGDTGLMFFLLRMAFWLGVVLVLLPSGSAQHATQSSDVGASDAISAASATVHDLRGFCTRQPDACTVGSQVAMSLGYRAQAGAKMLYDFLTEAMAPKETGALPHGTAPRGGSRQSRAGQVRDRPRRIRSPPPISHRPGTGRSRPRTPSAALGVSSSTGNVRCAETYVAADPREQTHVGADTGIGVLVKIERAADVRGKPLP